jgi:glycosyltransferase involved in cell wall biosynthesis
MNPIISICIPTFNRTNCLNNLLGNLAKIKELHSNDVEICISNNNSSDSTSEVLDKWRDKIEFKLITQSENIGASRNAFAVVKIATGKWLIIIGDDDEIILDNFSSLISLLRSSCENDWVLVGIADFTGKEHLLGDIELGRHDPISFRKILLRTGLYRYGFIGMHIFPNTLQKTFSNLSLAEGQPWPHLALLLRQLNLGHVQIFSPPIVSQAAGGAELFWKAGDWVHANMRKLNIIYLTKNIDNRNTYFYNLMILRELYSNENVKNLIAWKIREPNDFSSRAFYELSSKYIFPGYLSFLSIPHFALLLFLLIMPDRLMKMALKLLNKEPILDLYIADKELKKKFDGFDRGI